MSDKRILRKRYLQVIFSKFKTKVVDISSTILLPKKVVSIIFDSNGEASYCRLVSPYYNYEIVFGGDMLSRYLVLPEALSLNDMKKNFYDVQCFYRGIYYHEVAHLKFTAMGCMLIDQYAEEYRGSVHHLFNILEDIVIERYCMAVRYPYTKKYFNFLESKLFNEKFSSSYQDTGDFMSFCNWLLLKLRMRKAFTGSNKFVDEHPDYIKYVKDVMTEPDGVKRIEKTIVFFEWLLSQGLYIPMFVHEEDALPFSSRAGESENMSSEGQEASSNSFIETEEGTQLPGCSQSNVSAGEDEDEDDCEGESESMEHSIGRGLSAFSTASSFEEPAINELDLEDDFEAAINGETHTHIFHDAKKNFRPTTRAEEYVEFVCDKVSSIATQVATKIKTFKIRNKPRYQKGYPSGRLHVPSAIEGKPVNIFQRKESIGPQPDLAVYLLIDNSGSMDGVKSRIATEASLALSLACEKSHIPFAVSMFNTDLYGSDFCAVTYRIKEFKDDFSYVKRFFGLTCSDMDYSYPRLSSDVNVFTANLDEVSLRHVGQEYCKEKYNNKVLIVISDGYTCGSDSALTSVVKDLEKYFTIIGIGACTDAPSKFYPNCKIFSTEAELVGLPDYIGDVLVTLSKGGNKL